MIDVRNSILIHDFDLNSDVITKRALKLLKQIQKMTCGVPLSMVGNSQLDGSYPIWNQNLHETNVISIGVGNNIIFDKKLALLGAKVYMFDHTIAPKIPNKLKKSIKYFPYGIQGNRHIDQCLSLTQILTLCKLRKSKNTILKIDCEGVEWDVFLDNSTDILASFDQICVEFHNLDAISSKDLSEKYLKVFKKLDTIFVVTYLSPNNFMPILKLKNGIVWPFTLEMHLLRKDHFKSLKKGFVTKNEPNALSYQSSNWHLGKKQNLSQWFGNN